MANVQETIILYFISKKDIGTCNVLCPSVSTSDKGILKDSARLEAGAMEQKRKTSMTTAEREKIDEKIQSF